MHCNKCGQRMTVVNTKNEKNITFRYYKCSGCGMPLYTKELEDDYCEVVSAISRISSIKYGKEQKNE